MSNHLRAQAIAILKTARVAKNKLNYTGTIQWADRDQMHRAFDLFNEHSGQGPVFATLVPPHPMVFNWLLDVATEGVEAEQMSIHIPDHAGQ